MATDHSGWHQQQSFSVYSFLFLICFFRYLKIWIGADGLLYPMWQQKQQKVTEENKLIHVQREGLGQTYHVKFDLPYIPTSAGAHGAVFLYYLTHYLFLNQGSCNYPCVPQHLPFLPSTSPSSYCSIFLWKYCLCLLPWIPLLTLSIVFTPVKLHVPLSSQNDSCQECPGPPHFKSSDESPVFNLFILPSGVNLIAPALFLEIVFFT